MVLNMIIQVQDFKKDFFELMEYNVKHNYRVFSNLNFKDKTTFKEYFISKNIEEIKKLEFNNLAIINNFIYRKTKGKMLDKKAYKLSLDNCKIATKDFNNFKNDNVKIEKYLNRFLK